MRLALAPLLCVVLTAASGCGASDTPQAVVDGGSAGDDGSTTKADSIAFESATTLTLAPGEKADLRVVVLPAGEHRVRFSLVGDSLDGSLDADMLQTDQEGKAAVVLTAPQSATTFLVRATADDGPWAETAVSVSGTGFGSVTVTPKYAGTRSTEAWTLTGAALVACSDVKGIPPPDGPIAVTRESGKPLVLEGLPAGAKLAITARSGHAVGGCADVTPLSAGERREIEVKVADRPIELAQTDVSIELVMTPDGTVLKPWLDARIAQFVAGLAPAGGEAAALLDTMQAASTDPAEFASARQQEQWDSAAKGYFTALGKPLAERVKAWAAKGSISLLGGTVFTGRVAVESAIPVLRLQTVGGLDAAACGAAYSYTVVVSADPGDTIHVGGGIDVLPSAFVAAAADVGAKSPEAPGAVAAMQEVVGCPQLAKLLDDAGTSTSTCGLSCLDQLCRDALASMWARARSSSSNNFDVAHVSFTVSGQAEVDAEAVLRSFEGSWTGELNGLSETVGLSGTATGAAPP